MLKNYVVVLMLCSSALANAQESARRPEREQLQQQRRAAVRAVAKDIPSDSVPEKEASGIPRQLSPQERAELRQQLRQQRRDNPRQ
jgi:hypothetical protein